VVMSGYIEKCISRPTVRSNQRPRFVLLATLFLAVSCYLSVNSRSDAASEPLPLKKFVYRQNFEQEDPFQVWTANGSYRIHSKGLTAGDAKSGRKSFKLDVSLGTAKYLYLMIPVTVPCAGKLRFSGSLRIGKSAAAAAALGVEVGMEPSAHTGIVSFDHLIRPTDGWVTQRGDLVARGRGVAGEVLQSVAGGASPDDAGLRVQKIALLIYAEHGGDLTVYVDDLELTGAVPEVRAFAAQSRVKWQRYLTRVRETVRLKARHLIEDAGKLTRNDDRVYADQVALEARRTLGSLDAPGYPTGSGYRGLLEGERTLARLLSGQETSRLLVSPDLAVYPWQPYAAYKIVPEAYPLPVAEGNALSLAAAPAQFEPFSFVLHPFGDLADVKLHASALVGPGGSSLGADAVDLRLVKAWYRSGEGTLSNQGRTVLLPGLLLKDDALVQVDARRAKNFLRVSVAGKPRLLDISSPGGTRFPDNAVFEDSADLRPFSLAAGRNQQVWGTVHVPEGARPGSYQGTVDLTVAGKLRRRIGITLEVLDIALREPLVEYAIYYRARLAPQGDKVPGSEVKDARQYARELADLRDHGIGYPTVNQGDRFFGQALGLRKEAGLPTDKLYQLDGTGRPATAKQLEQLQDRVGEIARTARARGFGDVYFHAVDEASGDALRGERPAMTAVHAAGGKLFVACYDDAVGTVGDLLDRPILSGPFKPQQVEKWHRQGKLVFSYGNPQVGIEDPNLYRKNYGFGLWCAGYDGAMPYAYQHAFGNIWNDFDDAEFRDHVFAYPTTSGVVDTIEWEGFRSAVDDVRYLATLLNLKKMPPDAGRNWLCPRVDATLDMTAIRQQIIEKILK